MSRRTWRQTGAWVREKWRHGATGPLFIKRPAHRVRVSRPLVVCSGLLRMAKKARTTIGVPSTMNSGPGAMWPRHECAGKCNNFDCETTKTPVVFDTARRK